MAKHLPLPPGTYRGLVLSHCVDPDVRAVLDSMKEEFRAIGVKLIEADYTPLEIRTAFLVQVEKDFGALTDAAKRFSQALERFNAADFKTLSMNCMLDIDEPETDNIKRKQPPYWAQDWRKRHNRKR